MVNNLIDACQMLCATQSKEGASIDYLAKVIGYERIKRSLERALKNGDAVSARKAFQARALLLLRFREFRGLNSLMLKRLVLRACETNDSTFLMQLGRRLSEKPTAISDDQSEVIRILLLKFWDDPRYGQPLCRLTDQALTDFCEIALGLNHLSANSLSLPQIQQTRKRLKLKQGPKPHFKHVRLGEDGNISIS